VGGETAFQDAAPRTGMVWSACDDLAKLPRSNKAAYRRALLLVRSPALPYTVLCSDGCIARLGSWCSTMPL
jgi:hypothetical protein